MVDVSKNSKLGYYQYEPPEEYERRYFIDEFNKISFAIAQFVNEFIPTKNARVVTGSETLTIFDDVILASGDITITGTHALIVGDMVTLSGSTGYDGDYVVTAISTTTTFDVTATFVATGTGTAKWTSE